MLPVPRCGAANFAWAFLCATAAATEIRYHVTGFFSGQVDVLRTGPPAIPQPVTITLLIIGTALFIDRFRPLRRRATTQRVVQSTMAGCLVFASIVSAQEPAVIATGGGSVFIPNGTRGWSFTLSAPAIVTHVGVLDLDFTPFPGVPPSYVGLFHAHDVAIWKADTGEVLAQTNLPAGTDSLLIDRFRYEPIAPLPLAAGPLYVIGAHYITENLGAWPSGDFVGESKLEDVSTAPGLAIHTGRWSSGNTIAFPGGASTSPDPYFGPNFLFFQPSLDGDYDGNGTVDAADFVVWRKTDGTQSGYNIWRTNFGRAIDSISSSDLSGGAGPTASTSFKATVPEPASSLLLSFAFGAMPRIPHSSRRKRGQKSPFGRQY